MLHTTDKDGSIVKIKRQLRFDSAIQLQSSAIQGAQPTPQSLKCLLDSDKRLISDLDLKNKENQVPSLTSTTTEVAEFEDLKVKESNIQAPSSTDAIECNSNQKSKAGQQKEVDQYEQCTPAGAGKREIIYEQYSQNIGGSGSYFKLPWSSSGFSPDDQEEEEELREFLKNSKFQQYQKFEKDKGKEQEAVNDKIWQPEFDTEDNLKMNTIDQLVNLKQIFAQKQFNDNMKQFRIPSSKPETTLAPEDKNKENLHIQSKQGFNSDEKKIIYDASYLQRLGLPIPETVMKQKQLQLQIQREAELAASLIPIPPSSVPAPTQVSAPAAAPAPAATTILPNKFDTLPLSRFQGEQFQSKITPASQQNQPTQNQNKSGIATGLSKNEEYMKPSNSFSLKPNFGSISTRPTQVNTKGMEIERAQGKIIGFRKEGSMLDAQEVPKLLLHQQPSAQTQQQQLLSKVQQKLAEKTEQRIENQKAKEDNYPSLVPPQYNFKEPRLPLGTIFQKRNNPGVQEKEQKAAQFNDPSMTMVVPTNRVLTEDEKKLVYVVWVYKNMQDFNYWIQKSKTTMVVKFEEQCNLHTCYLKLEPIRPLMTKEIEEVIQAHGNGCSKKEAKKSAFEKLAWQVIQCDTLFWEGITGQAYIESLKKEFHDNEKMSKLSFKTMFLQSGDKKISIEPNAELSLKRKAPEQLDGGNEIHPKLKFKIMKNHHRIQEYLKGGNSIEALEKLALIGGLKSILGYRDFCYLWSHAVQCRDLTVMKVILDVIHYRKFSPLMSQTISTVSSSETIVKLCTNMNADPKQCFHNLQLKQYLGVGRSMCTQNSFDAWNGSFELVANEKLYYQLIKDSLNSQSIMTVFAREEIQNFSLQNSLQLVESLRFEDSTEITPTKKSDISGKSQRTPLRGLGSEELKSEQLSGLSSPFNLPFFKQLSDNSNKGIRQKKDPYLQYLNWEDLNSLYTRLIYETDPLFCMQACELIYTYGKVDPEKMISNSADYYSHKKIILFQELFESLLLYQNNTPRFSYLGELTFLGCNYEEDLIGFKIQEESGEIIRQESLMLSEGDICDVRDQDGNVLRCLLKQISMTPGSIEIKLSTVVPYSMKSLFNSSTIISSICRVSSFTNEILNKSKVLDSMCTKTSMFHSILKSLVDPITSAKLHAHSGFPNALTALAQINMIATQVNLNQEQLTAVKQGSVAALTVVSGIKYTGKFKVATCIIREWFEQSNLKILVKCKTQRRARDFFQHLSDESQMKQQHNAMCLVLGPNGPVEFIKGKVKQVTSVQIQSKCKRWMEESRVVITCDSSTIGSSTAISNSMGNCQFNRVVIFEAEQQREDELWEYLIRNCNQCVIIGDFTNAVRTQTDSIFSTSREGNRSIMEAFGKCQPLLLKVRYFHETTIQSNQIYSLHRRLFYPLSMSNSNYEVALDEILVVAVKGAQEWAEDMLSSPAERRLSGVFNLHEAYLVSGIVSSLMKENKVKLQDITVVSASIGQKTEIERSILALFGITIKVQLIDEDLVNACDYIIFSGVFSNNKGVCSTSGKAEVLSTLLQLSLRQFIFVGDIDLYATDPTWREFFCICQSKMQVKFWGKTNRNFEVIKEPGQF